MTRVLCTMLNRYIVFESEDPNDLLPSKIFQKLNYWVGSNSNSYLFHNKEWHNSSRINLKESFNFQQETNSENWKYFKSLDLIPNFRDFTYYKCIYCFKIYEADRVEILHNLTHVKMVYSKIDDMDARTKADFWNTLDEMCIDYIDTLSCDEVFDAAKKVLENLGSDCDVSSKPCENVREFLKFVEQLLASVDLVTASSDKMIEIYTKIGDKIGCDIVSKLIKDIEDEFKDDIEDDIKDKIDDFEIKPLNPPIIDIPESLKDDKINAYELEDGIQVNVQFEENVKPGSILLFEILDSLDNLTVINHIVTDKDYTNGFKATVSLPESIFNNDIYTARAKIKSADERTSEYSNLITFEVNRELASIIIDDIDIDNLVEPFYQKNDVILSGKTTNVENDAQVKLVIEDLVYYAIVTDNTFSVTVPIKDFQIFENGKQTVVATVTNSWNISARYEKDLLIDVNAEDRRMYIDSISDDDIITESDLLDELKISGTTLEVLDGEIVTITFNRDSFETEIEEGKFEIFVDPSTLSKLKNKKEYIVAAEIESTDDYPKLIAQKIIKTDFVEPTIKFDTYHNEVQADGKIVEVIESGKITKSERSKDLIIAGLVTNVEDQNVVYIEFNNIVYESVVDKSSFKFKIPSEIMLTIPAGTYTITSKVQNHNKLEATYSKEIEIIDYDLIRVKILHDGNNDEILTENELVNNLVEFEIEIDSTIPDNSKINYTIITTTNTISKQFIYLKANGIFKENYEINKADKTIQVKAEIVSTKDYSTDMKYIDISLSDCEFKFKSFMLEFECFPAFDGESDKVNCAEAGNIEDEEPCCLDENSIDIDKFCLNFDNVSFKEDSLQEIGHKLGIDFNQIIQCQLSRLTARALKCKAKEIIDPIVPPIDDKLEEFFPTKSPVKANSNNLISDFLLKDDLKNATEYHFKDETDPTEVFVNLSKYSMIGENGESFIRIYFSQTLLDDAIIDLTFASATDAEFEDKDDETTNPDLEPTPPSSTIPSELIIEDTLSVKVSAGFEFYDYYITVKDDSISKDAIYKVEISAFSNSGYDKSTIGESSVAFLKLINSDGTPVMHIDDGHMIESNQVSHYVYFSEPLEESVTYPFILEGLSAIEDVDYKHEIIFTNGVRYDKESKTIDVPAKTWEFAFHYPTINNDDRNIPRQVKVFIGRESAIGTIADDGDTFKERKSYINFKEKSNYIKTDRFDLNPKLWYLKLEANKSVVTPGEFISFKLSIVDYKGAPYLGSWSQNFEIYADIVYIGNYSKHIDHFNLPRTIKMENSVMEFDVEVTGADTTPQALMIAKLSTVTDKNVPISEGEIDLYKEDGKEHFPNLVKSAYDTARVVINSHNEQVPEKVVEISLEGPSSISRGNFGEFTVKSNKATVNNALTFPIEYTYYSGAKRSEITELATVSIPPNSTQTKFMINSYPVATGKETAFKIKLSDPISTEFDTHNFINNHKVVTLKNATNDVIVTLMGMTSVYEGNPAKYEVLLSRPVKDDLTFKILLNLDETTTSDFKELPDEVTIPAGSTKGEFEILTENDGLREEDESFQVTIHSPSILDYTYRYSNQELTTYITDSLTKLGLNVESITVEESKTAIHKVTLASESTFDTPYKASLLYYNGEEGFDYSNRMTFSDNILYANGYISVPEKLTEFTVSYPVPNDTEKALDSKDPNYKERKYTLNIGGFVGTAIVIDNKEPELSDKVYLNIEGPTSIYEGHFGTYKITLSSPANSDMTINIDYNYMNASEADIQIFTNQVKIFKGQREVEFSVKVIDDELVDDNEEFEVVIGSYEGGSFETLIEQNMSVITSIMDNDFAEGFDFRLIEYPFIGWFGTTELYDTFAVPGDGSAFINKDFRLDAYTVGITEELESLQKIDYVESFRTAIRYHLRENLSILNNTKSMRAYISKYNIDKVFGFDLNDYSLEYYEVYNIFVTHRLLDDYGSLDDLKNNPAFNLENLKYYSIDRLIAFFKRWEILKKIGKPGSKLLYSSPTRKQLLQVLFDYTVILFNPDQETLPEENCWRHYIIELDKPDSEIIDPDPEEPEHGSWDDFRDPQLTLSRLRYYSLSRLLNFLTQFRVVEILQVTPPEFYLMTRFEIYQWLYYNKVVTFSYSHESQMLEPRSDVNIEPSGKETPKHIEYALEVTILRQQFSNFD